MKGKIYLSDEGFGPIVRQKAILDELLKREPGLEMTVQTHVHMKDVKRMMPGVQTLDRFNQITWKKNKNGSPDVKAIAREFENYEKKSDSFLKTELNDLPFDFLISDFVYEAFEAGRRKKIPAFGVAHFTWDWFFSKLFPPPLKSAITDRFFDFAAKARSIYFPPFTPGEILNHYKKNAKQVPFIIKPASIHKKQRKKGKFNVLLVDSGAGVLKNSIQLALEKIPRMDDFHFFVSSALAKQGKNISILHPSEFFIDYIREMDLVIGRAGFNTISECIALRTPMLLISEEFNPELQENIVNLKKSGLGSFISLSDFESQLHRILPRFIKAEYPTLHANMQQHEFQANGAEVIAKDMLNQI